MTNILSAKFLRFYIGEFSIEAIQNSFFKINITPTSYIYSYEVDYKKLRMYFVSTETIIQEQYKEELLKRQ